MALSTRYHILQLRIEALKNRFLQFDNLDSFLTENQDKLMSFRLLVHAELEYFFEEYARSTINIFLNKWTIQRQALPGLRYLILYSPNKFENQHFLTIDNRIKGCCQSFIARIDSNHGIKEKNIVSLFVPLGVTAPHLDTAWLATMDSFGTRRGSYAHKSQSVQIQIDKSTELNELRNVMDGVKKVDAKLQKVTTRHLRKPF